MDMFSRDAPARSSFDQEGGSELQIAVILPCYNEGAAIGGVVNQFRQALPQARIYVYDNNSTDDTSDVAMRNGAIVFTEPRQGKGYVVRRMFADVEADIYVLADGDGTYDSGMATEMIEHLIANNLDMVTGVRRKRGESAYRFGHETGNRLLTGAAKLIFKARLSDMLSGYRVFSRRFVKSFPARSEGFEIETELTVHALTLQLPIDEIDTDYFDRAEGTASKLSTYKDGVRILYSIFRLYRHKRPLSFFSIIALIMLATSLGLAIPLLPEYLDQGTVSRLPTALLATGLAIISALSISCGLILDLVAESRLEAKRLAYLSFRGPGNPVRSGASA